MAHDPDLLDQLEAFEVTSWNGVVYRFTASERPPEQENTTGARWNPPEVPAIYTALDRETLLAEFEHLLSLFAPTPRREAFRVYRIRLAVEGIVDLRVEDRLASVGISSVDVSSDDYSACQRVGGAASWLPRGGLLVPSARRPEGSNLVVFSHAQDADFEFEVEWSGLVEDL